MGRTSRDVERTETFVGVPAGDAELMIFQSDGSRMVSVAFGTPLLIGRGPDCDVVIEHRSVSRRHARLVPGDPSTIEDLSSSNGTLIESRRISPGVPMPLQPGQVVSIGAAALVLRITPARAAEPDGGTPLDLNATMPPPSEADSSTSMARLERLLTLVARGDISILLLGETGVGKELAAETLHAASPRAQGPFVRINCAALPEALLEAELFGFERGAFTGADRAKKGLLETATGGTVFLDEVGELPYTTQAKLLRALERGETLPLGGTQPRAIDVRFVAATNRDLRAAVASGAFRRDLYYRLAGVEIRIPPLRERRTEILALARTFMEQARARLGLPALRLSRASERRLLVHDWPGNIRELRNAIDRAALLSEGGCIEPDHLGLDGSVDSVVPSHPGLAHTPDTLPGAVADFERQRILEALARTDGNQTAAARLLGIPRRTLVHKLREYGIGRARR